MLDRNRSGEGLKHDTGKPRVELLPFRAMEYVARVQTGGAEKYGDHNWRAGMKRSRLLGALLRHVFAWARGEDTDPEWGLPHLAHAACCVLFLLEYQLEGIGEDDRYRPGVDQNPRLDPPVKSPGFVKPGPSAELSARLEDEGCCGSCHPQPEPERPAEPATGWQRYLRHRLAVAARSREERDEARAKQAEGVTKVIDADAMAQMRRERDEALADRDFFDEERLALVDQIEGDNGLLARCEALAAEAVRLREERDARGPSAEMSIRGEDEAITLRSALKCANEAAAQRSRAADGWAKRARNAEAEVEAWKDASGLMCGGDPDGVTPVAAQRHREEVEGRAVRLADGPHHVRRLLEHIIVPPGVCADCYSCGAAAPSLDELKHKAEKNGERCRGEVAEEWVRAILANTPTPEPEEAEAEPPESPPWSSPCDGCEHRDDTVEHCGEVCMRPPRPKPPWSARAGRGGRVMPSKIEWCEETWNPVVGCTPVSPGCQHCYAARFAHRGLSPRHRGLTRVGPHGPQWNGTVRIQPDLVNRPMGWRKPRMVFVCSMSDLFHSHVPPAFVEQVFDVMRRCPQHTFQLLTKRPLAPPGELGCGLSVGDWPRNVWAGVTVENREALARVEHLRHAAGPVRFLSCEPLLEDLGELDLNGIHWCICGGETGPGARPMRVEWARSIRDQCQEAGVQFFFKRHGGRPVPGVHERELDGRTWDEMPGVP